MKFFYCPSNRTSGTIDLSFLNGPAGMTMPSPAACDYLLCKGANAALCIADTEEATTPMEATADWGYLRLRDQGYTAADLEEWSRTIQRPSTFPGSNRCSPFRSLNRGRR